MIHWTDHTNAIAIRFACTLGSARLTLYRASSRDVWWVDFTAPASVCRSTTFHLDALLDVDAAMARALLGVKPAVDAVAERAAEVARDIAVAVAGARLDGVG